MNPSLILARFFGLNHPFGLRVRIGTQPLIRRCKSFRSGSTAHRALGIRCSNSSNQFSGSRYRRPGYGRWKGFLQFPGSRTSVIVTLERPMRAATVLVVRAFHAWTLLDNFQWPEGYTERYGLIYTDFRNQKRTKRIRACGTVELLPPIGSMCECRAVLKSVLTQLWCTCGTCGRFALAP